MIQIAPQNDHSRRLINDPLPLLSREVGLNQCPLRLHGGIAFVDVDRLHAKRLTKGLSDLTREFCRARLRPIKFQRQPNDQGIDVFSNK